MIRFDWDGLHLGDHVYVHTMSGGCAAAESGTVSFVAVNRRGPHAVGIRLDRDPEQIVWPTRSSVHLDAHAAPGACTCCDIEAGTPAGRVTAG